MHARKGANVLEVSAKAAHLQACVEQKIAELEMAADTDHHDKVQLTLITY